MSCNCLSVKNPFQITTPEDLTAEEAVSLFVDVFTDFPKIIDPGHVFLIGPRGVGKSMMFRYLQADCQCIVQKCGFSELSFVGIYIPVKNWSLVKTELKRLEDRHASEIFNEHLMVTQIIIETFNSLLNNRNAIESINPESLFDYYQEVFIPMLDSVDDKQILGNELYPTKDILKNIKLIINDAYRLAMNYTKKLAFTNELPIFEGALYDYQEFLIPLLTELSNVSGFPKGTIYLMIDDAHFLSEIQTRILNSWIATRTSRKISIKVSSQYDYKTYYTVTGATIDSPHDFSEVDMASVYTTNSAKSNYKDRIKSIVDRRLRLFGIISSVNDFFPYDKKQEEEINKIAEAYREKFDNGQGRGYYRDDDAYRYARPDYIKNLAGISKSSSSYSYSGFDQLVHLSSGIVRYFLEPAHIMYSKAIAAVDNGSETTINYISDSIQNDVVRDIAENFLFSELERYKNEGHEKAIPREDLRKLSNLVQGLGGLFRQILLSDRSERRVFSIAISDELSEEAETILNIGINFGFFHKSTIGRKDRKSGGRTKLYIMNRRLAPMWNLDPTGFAGYLSIRNSLLIEGMYNPQSLLRRIERKGSLDELEYRQLNLFDSFEEQDEDFLNV